MNEVRQIISELLEKNRHLVFLVGSGCSVDPPSSLPNGHKMREDLINFTCAESEIQRLLELRAFKLESLIEILRNQIDRELNLINYFELCNKPNLQHYFLVERIIKGNFILTTNFDLLIEYALLNSNLSKENILPLITSADYRGINKINDALENGGFVLVKLHGSLKNVINNIDTKKELISLISTIGSRKNSFNLLLQEPYKRPVLEKILDNGTLIVMGYSGFEDIDVLPMLKGLRRINKIYWINHTGSNDGNDIIYEIIKNEKYSDDLNQILGELKTKNSNVKIYRIDTNITELIKDLVQDIPNIDLNSFNVEFFDWLKDNIEISDPVKKYVIPHIIYFNYDRYEDALRCGVKSLALMNELNSTSDKLLILNNLGWIYFTKGNYSEAITYFDEALQIAKEMGDIKRQLIYQNNIGDLFERIREYPMAMDRYQKVLKLAEDHGELTEKIRAINSIAEIYEMQENYSEAIKYYREAIKNVEELGDLESKAIYLNNIAIIYYKQKNYRDALKLFQKSANISKEIGNYEQIAIALNNFGVFYQNTKNFPIALSKFESAYKIYESMDDLMGKATLQQRISNVYFDMKKYDEMLKRLKIAFQISIELENEFLQAEFMNEIGKANYFLKNYNEALNWFRSALNLAEELNYLRMKADFLNNIAGCYYLQKNYKESLKAAEESLQTLHLIGHDRSEKSDILIRRIESIKKILKID